MPLAPYPREVARSALPPSLAGTAPGLSLMLVEEALERMGLARACIERAADPGCHLLSAARRIRELPSALAGAADSALVANLADVAEYICRRLCSVGDATDLATLADMCDLLREIRCAWVTESAPALILCGAAAWARA